MANPLQYSCLENPMDRGGLRASPWESEESGRAEHLIPPHPHPYSRCVSQSPLLRDALSKGINMGGGWLQLSSRRELGFQQTAETAGQESMETPHLAAAWLEEFTASGRPSVPPSGSWDHL